MKKKKENKILENSLWIMSDKIFNMVVGILITGMVARYFGPEKLGIFNYSLSFITLFTAISTLGLETLVVKAIVTQEKDEGTILYTSLVMRVIGGILLIILSNVLIKVIEPDNKQIHTIVVILSFGMLFKSLDVIEYWIHAHQNAKYSSFVRIATIIFTSILKVALIFLKGSIIKLSFIYIFDAIMAGVIYQIMFFKKKNNNIGFSVDFKYGIKLLKQSWAIVLSGLMITLYMQLDKIMLGKMMNDYSQVGIYTAATQIATMWYFVPMALINSYKPVIMMAKENSADNYLNKMQKLYDLVSLSSLVFSILVIIFGKVVIRILFGKEFFGAYSILIISVWAGIFALLGSARSVWLISEGKQKYTMLYTFVGFIVNLVLNLLLINRFGGIGAAIATLIAQFVANVITLYFIEETKISSLMILKSLSLKRILRFRMKGVK